MIKKLSFLIQELASYDEESRKPFPRADVRKITGGDVDRELDFVGDLNAYDMTISGPISWKASIVEWPRKKAEEVLEYSTKSFFEHYPQYKPLELLISEKNTPDLYADLQLHNKMRMVLRKLLTQLLSGEHDQ